MKTISQLRIKKLLFAVAAAFGIMLMVVAISPVFGGTKAEAQISTNARNLSALIAVSDITDGGSLGGGGLGDEDLGSLIVLQGLFPTSRNATQNVRDLTGLIAVSNIVGDGGLNGGGLSGDTSLGDLIVLNNLFLDP